MIRLDAINYLENEIGDPTQGLPEDIFRFATRITPMVNVDLLIQDEDRRTLLAWRHDPNTKDGWHVPGGIIRYMESFETRLHKVAEIEIGAVVKAEDKPLAVNQMIYQELKERGHFISFLYRCYLSSEFVPDNGERTPSDNGYLRWHEGCPGDLLAYHEIYRQFM